jgi:hypothetical protein
LKRSAVLSAFVVGLAVLAAGCSGVSQEGPQGPTTLAEAKALAAERGVPILLDFYTDW